MAARLLRRGALFLALSALPAAAADFQIVVTDGPGAGFNDATPATPIGGNTGTTIGAQRLIVFQEAARIWGALLPSDVPIKVDSSFSALTCSETTAVLGSAGATAVQANFANAPAQGTWYAKALSDKLAGSPQGSNPNSIRARFNSELGKTGCLTGTFFYLGLDTNHGSNIDLLTVVLHEFGHGLGFASTADSTGQFFGSGTNRFPGAFDRLLLDTTAGKTWDQMVIDADRAASAINTGNLVWNGANAATFAKGWLAARPRLLVNAPASVAGVYAIGTAAFGPALSTPGVTGDIVAAQDPSDASGPSVTDACSPLTNAPAVGGKIALVDRGTCTFVVKVRNAQSAGAIGVVIVNNVSGNPVGMAGTDATIAIPVVMVSQADGARLRGALPANANIGADPSQLSGTDTAGRLVMYAPDPYESGSSVSHWDTSAFPSLLMEPNISGDLGLTTDATLPALRDIGWFLGSTAIPTTYVLPSSARAPGKNNAFYTTSLWVANTGTADSTVVLKFLGNNQDGSSGSEVTRVVPAGQTVSYADVLNSLFGVSSGYGAIRISADSNQLRIVSQTSTPPPSGVGTFGQAVPAASGTGLVTTAAPKALFSLRQDAAFRTNAVIANATGAPAHVDLQLFASAGTFLGSGAHDLAPLEMRQIDAVVTALGGPDGTRDAYLVLSTPTGGARIATYAAVIDQRTNDPRTILPVTLGKLGANATWLLPSSAHAAGKNNAFYTTDLTLGNTGTTDASVTLKFLGNNRDGRSGPEIVKSIPANSAVTYADVLGSLFGVSSDYGAILVTSESTDLRVLSQTSTPPPDGIGTFGQSVPAAGAADFVTAAAPKVLVGLRQDAAFRTNAVIANATGLPTHVDLVLKSETGATIGTGSADLQPYEMRQVDGVVTALGAPDGTANAVLQVSTTTAAARVATYAAIIDQKTNDPRTVLP
jgi:hypothetical protein